MVAGAVAAFAIVIQNQVALRGAARDSAPQQAVLWQGELLEVRGEALDYLQVYDHRRERAGYVKARDVYRTGFAAQDAPELLAVVRFLRATPGAEALGIGLTAAYLKAAPPEQLTAEPFDLLGTFAERLAERASARQPGGASAATLAAHLEVVAQYGVRLPSFERDGAVQVCYDGEMFRRVLAMPGAEPAARARAALGLTRPECVDPALSPTTRQAYDEWRADVLERVPPAQLDGELRARLHARRAAVHAALAFAQARRGLPAQAEGARARDELAAADASALSEAGRREYEEAGIRVGASRWAAEPPAPAPASHGLGIVARPAASGETCVLLVDSAHDERAPLARRCTYATVWAGSARPSPSGTALALAVQPLEAWRELWLFRRVAGEWRVSVLPPAISTGGVAYVEFAGWVPGRERLLVARESAQDGRYRRRFEVIELNGLAVERGAG
ncbi:MAG: hypothetical protein JSR54_15845, partial [Proteobacteria bacterium]|nr:hypothetical protein [Pseudomonadota bacterium]